MQTPPTDRPEIPTQTRGAQDGPPAWRTLREWYLVEMRRNIAEAEAWQKKVAAWEAEASDRAKANNRPMGGTTLQDSYAAGKMLETQHGYKLAVAIRNSRQTWAQVYAAAATALSTAAAAP